MKLFLSHSRESTDALKFACLPGTWTCFKQPQKQSSRYLLNSTLIHPILLQTMGNICDNRSRQTNKSICGSSSIDGKVTKIIRSRSSTKHFRFLLNDEDLLISPRSI